MHVSSFRAISFPCFIFYFSLFNNFFASFILIITLLCYYRRWIPSIEWEINLWSQIRLSRLRYISTVYVMRNKTENEMMVYFTIFALFALFSWIWIIITKIQKSTKKIKRKNVFWEFLITQNAIIISQNSAYFMFLYFCYHHYFSSQSAVFYYTSFQQLNPQIPFTYFTLLPSLLCYRRINVIYHHLNYRIFNFKAVPKRRIINLCFNW